MHLPSYSYAGTAEPHHGSRKNYKYLALQLGGIIEQHLLHKGISNLAGDAGGASPRYSAAGSHHHHTPGHHQVPVDQYPTHYADEDFGISRREVIGRSPKRGITSELGVQALVDVIQARVRFSWRRWATHTRRQRLETLQSSVLQALHGAPAGTAVHSTAPRQHSPQHGTAGSRYHHEVPAPLVSPAASSIGRYSASRVSTEPSLAPPAALHSQQHQQSSPHHQHHTPTHVSSDVAQALGQHLATVRESQDVSLSSEHHLTSARSARPPTVEQPCCHSTSAGDHHHHHHHHRHDEPHTSARGGDLDLSKLAQELSADQACIDEVIKLASILWDSGILMVPMGRQQMLPASLLLRLLDRCRLAQLRDSLRLWWHKCSMEKELHAIGMLPSKHSDGHHHHHHHHTSGSDSDSALASSARAEYERLQMELKSMQAQVDEREQLRAELKALQASVASGKHHHSSHAVTQPSLPEPPPHHHHHHHHHSSHHSSASQRDVEDFAGLDTRSVASARSAASGVSRHSKASHAASRVSISHSDGRNRLTRESPTSESGALTGGVANAFVEELASHITPTSAVHQALPSDTPHISSRRTSNVEDIVEEAAARHSIEEARSRSGSYAPSGTLEVAHAAAAELMGRGSIAADAKSASEDSDGDPPDDDELADLLM
eukprot:CAMPEP_0178407810 /NCGR_PEP_ID=MMETSP0689_2-20121128/19618_1 /TAXON_ID=160604 /ORGANISM="Amphidinium massartii, Strain CS-259" /LENGTH=662 /DNA_ID=CAMNT_0020028891 /DNA_START=22 /DNA_END=2010 /DNA_ORIENTATION=+